MATAHFQNLSDAVCQHLAAARRHLRIAMCWFSHRAIFDILVKKLRAGVRVELILEYDSQNIHSKGLDFQRFIRLGGELYAYRDTALMHHKFALIDDDTLLTGSYNWTYTSSAENLLTTGDPGLVGAYREEFNRLKGLSVQIRKIRPAEVKPFATFPLFQNTHFQLADLRRKISVGAAVWWVNAGPKPETGAEHFRTHRLPFDSGGLLLPYWAAYRVWDESLFDEIWPEIRFGGKAAALRSARQFARRMRVGDVVLAVSGRQRLVALGVVQSDPLPAPEAGYSSYREVQWLRVFLEAPVELPKAVPPGEVGRFRGSALELVQRIW